MLSRTTHGEYVHDMTRPTALKCLWSMLKRVYIGSYHYMTAKSRYMKLLSFRRNTTQIRTQDFIEPPIERIAGKRLTYKGLING